MWCGVLWCGVVQCGAVWCGVVWCGVSVLTFNTWSPVLIFPLQSAGPLGVMVATTIPCSPRCSAPAMVIPSPLASFFSSTSYTSVWW